MLAASRSKVEVDWATVNAQLPVGHDPESKARRDRLYNRLDSDGTGILSLATIQQCFCEVLQRGGISQPRPVIEHGFYTARDVVEPVAQFRKDQIDKHQFHVLLRYLKCYVELWEFWDRISTAEDHRVGLHEFVAMQPIFHRWGFQNLSVGTREVPAVLQQKMDSASDGRMPFLECADFCLHFGLRQLTKQNSPDHHAALQALHKDTEATRSFRFHPELSARQSFLPARGVSGPQGIAQTQWQTTYKTHFPHPLPTGELQSARSPIQLRQTKPRAFQARIDATPLGTAIKDSGLGSGAMTDRSHLNRRGLQAQLQQHLDMATTGQMRKIFAAAGGLIAAEASPRKVMTRLPSSVKALSVAINYFGHNEELRGSIDNQAVMCDIWMHHFDVPPGAIRTLRDDGAGKMPTKANIVDAIRWLVQGAEEGDTLFFHYSGHSGCTRASAHNAYDPRSEILVPVDYQRSGIFEDEELRRIMLLPLPQGVSLFGVLDCCHAEQGVDLPFNIKMGSDGSSVSMSKTPKKYMRGSTAADVVMLSSSLDLPTGALMGVAAQCPGAITRALQEVLSRRSDASFHRVLQLTWRYLKSGQYMQVPVLSSEHMLRLDSPLVGGPAKAQPSAPAGMQMSGGAHRFAQRPARSKALSIAINYVGMRGELRGCINDQEVICDLWKTKFGIPSSCIRTLNDGDRRSANMPTKANMLQEIQWLIKDAQSGDKLFFHYSGHGGQTRDRSGDERDQKDETLIPVDYQRSGMITDDDLRKLMVLPLPEGVSLLGLLDCCHSGTGMDLPFVAKLGVDGRSVSLSKKPRRYINGSSPAEVVMLSGCMDKQTSADAYIGSEYSGAMTAALHEALSKRPDASYHRLLQLMRRFMKNGGYTQVPQLSSERMLRLDMPVLRR